MAFDSHKAIRREVPDMHGNAIKRVKRLALLVLLSQLLGCGDDSPATASSASEVKQLTEGQVTGIDSPFDGAITVFRGLPYAEPPVGDLRWQAPQPPATWSGVRVADTFADSCHQPRHSSSFVWRREDFSVSEDCLYLNVWAPERAEKLPVMVWFHGGSHVSGQGHSLIFDGTTLAQHGVLVVTINYRLGPLGFLAHPWLSEETTSGSTAGTSGNYGLMDKIAALKWVNRNIEVLGGDPLNVTIFGQSAGSQSVCSLMTAPSAQGLFHKAIGQSAACVNQLTQADANGHERGQALVDALGAASIEDLRGAEPDALLVAMTQSDWESGSRIVIDGRVLPRWPHEVFAAGEQSEIPLMLGFLADEGYELFEVERALTEAELQGFLRYVGGDRAAELKAEYDASSMTPGELKHAISTDLFMAYGMRQWASYHADAGQETYLYFMDHVPPAFHIYMPDQPFLALEEGPRSGGAYHSGDLAYVFGTIDKVGYDWTDTDRKVSAQIMAHWTHFARTGSPNVPGKSDWPAFNTIDLHTRVINSAPTTVNGVRNTIMSIFESAE
jgi:para-nitrobenzyl esterase